jgi:hypothetical protein
VAEMPVALYRAPVSPGALVVLTRLWAHASAGVRWVHPSVARLQEELGIANGTIYRRLRELTEAGVIERTIGVSLGGRRVQGWALRDFPPVGAATSDVSEVEGVDPDDEDSNGVEVTPPTDGSPDAPADLPRVGTDTSDARESPPPSRGNRLPTGSSHMKLPHEAPTGALEDDAFPPTKAELEAWQGESPPAPPCARDEPGQSPADGTLRAPDQRASGGTPNVEPGVGAAFALTPPQDARAASRPSAAQRRQDRALAAWEAYEAHRRQLWPRARGRQVTDKDLRAIAKLVEHIRKRRGCPEADAWAELEAYGRGALEHAAAAERGETGDSPAWATTLVGWRSDGGEWGWKRYERWSGRSDAPAPRRASRGPVDPATQDHDAEVPF